MRNLLLAILAVGLSGCDAETQKEYEARQRTDTAESLSPLFVTPEGCQVYEFKAHYQWNYLTTCPGSVSSEHQRRSGKTTRTEMGQVQTVVSHAR